MEEIMLQLSLTWSQEKRDLPCLDVSLKSILKKVILLSIFMTIVIASQAQTVLFTSSASGSWESTNSPFILKGDITVGRNETLEIGPGVEIIFDGPHRLYVYGSLSLIGSEREEVVVNSRDYMIGNLSYSVQEPIWGGILINSIEGVEIKYINFKNFGINEAISIQDSENVIIEKCKFSNNSLDALSDEVSVISIINSTNVTLSNNIYADLDFSPIPHIEPPYVYNPSIIFAYNNVNLIIEYQIFADLTHWGGIVYVKNTDNHLITNNQIKINNNVFSRNIGLMFGALTLENESPTTTYVIYSNVLIENNMPFEIGYDYEENIDIIHSPALTILGKNIVVYENNIVHNHGEVGAGILARPTGYIDVFDNHILKNNGQWGVGVYISVSEQVNEMIRFYGNSLFNNFRYGNHESGVIHIKNGTISSNINPSDIKSGFHFEKNVFYYNYSDAIYLENSDIAFLNGFIYHNTSLKGTSHGIYSNNTLNNRIVVVNSIIWNPLIMPSGASYQIYSMNPSLNDVDSYILNTVLFYGSDTHNLLVGDFTNIHWHDPMPADLHGHDFRVKNPLYSNITPFLNWNPQYIGIYDLFDPVNNPIDVSSYDEITFKAGWNWVSFPKLPERDPYSDDSVDFYTIATLLSDKAVEIITIDDDSGEEISDIYFSNVNEWFLGTIPFKSTKGYKILMNEDFTFTIDDATTINPEQAVFLEANQDNYVGYFIKRENHLIDALSPGMLYYFTEIKTAEGAIFNTPNGILHSSRAVTLKYGDMIVLKTKSKQAFKWEIGFMPTLPSISPVVELFSYEKKSDYISVFFDFSLDSNVSPPDEIAVFVNGVCKGAAVFQGTITEILVYLDDDDFGHELEIVFGWRNMRMPNQKIEDFAVVNQNTQILDYIPLRSIYGTSYHHVMYTNKENLKDNETIQPFIQLQQNYPNPFNPSTRIDFYLSHDDSVQLSVYNIRGQKVRDIISGVLLAGKHFVIWDGTDNDSRNVASGIYFYRLNTQYGSETKRMALIK